MLRVMGRSIENEAEELDEVLNHSRCFQELMELLRALDQKVEPLTLDKAGLG